jgi:threonine dehydrogenase-like Zn-dependent dehydrogenase
MNKVRMGVIGLGCLGYMLIETILACEEAEVVAVCDVYEDRVNAAAELVEKTRGNTPEKYTDYKDVLNSENVDAVLVATSWETHISIAIEAMKAKKITALEVGGACSIEECWKLVHTYEETGTPIMMMENCCYDKFELLSTALVRSGKLGEIVHCHGAYGHDLRDEIAGGTVRRHYRLPNYIHRNCENYPTHELGPIAKILNINRGNRMVSLVSVASKAAGMKDFVENNDTCPDKSLKGTEFRQGDIVETIITCSGGQTISLKLDTTLPRYYSREFTVRGTRGMTWAEANMVIVEGECNTHEYRENCDNIDKYSDFIPDIWKNITDEQKRLGHGGMDYLEFKAFFKAIINNEEMPIDVYDAASWMCITSLSEYSIAQGGTPQAIPDFTSGRWVIRKPIDVIELPKP